MELPEYFAISDNEVLMSSHIETMFLDTDTEVLHIYTRSGGDYQLKNDDALNFLLQFPCGYFKRAYGIDNFLDSLVDKYGYTEDFQ